MEIRYNRNINNNNGNELNIFNCDINSNDKKNKFDINNIEQKSDHNKQLNEDNKNKKSCIVIDKNNENIDKSKENEDKKSKNDFKKCLIDNCDKNNLKNSIIFKF